MPEDSDRLAELEAALAKEKQERIDAEERGSRAVIRARDA